MLCKLLAHNLCCFIQEEHELGDEPLFWAHKPKSEPRNEMIVRIV